MTTVKHYRGSEQYHTRECEVVQQAVKDPKEMRREVADAWGYDECEQCKHGNVPNEQATTWATTHQRRTDRHRCRECSRYLGSGYLCDGCDTVDGWPE